MGKGRDKQGREPKKKKKKKAKQPNAAVPQNVQFRHHSVVIDQPETPRTTE